MVLPRGFRVVRFWIVAALVALALPLSSVQARPDPPDLWLPLPMGEAWQVIQGFYCGTHGNEREVDIARIDGSSVGVPVRAAASGKVHLWTGSTLLLSHGNHYYTEYTHLSQAFFTRPGTPVHQGQEIGTIDGTDHLHFSFYYSPAASYFNRETLALDFLDGYSLHDTGGCNQHSGMVLMAQDVPDTTPPDISFQTDLEPDRWYCDDQSIEFHLSDDRWTTQFRQQFDQEPDDGSPLFETDIGYVQLSWAGEGLHTLFVHAWDASGNEARASLGPFGYDASPPSFALPSAVPEERYLPDDDGSILLSWQAASDGDGSGVAGYRFYLGHDPDGTSETVSADHQAVVRDVQPGCYLLRVQAFDAACGESAWTTLQKVLVSDRDGIIPEGACQSLSEDAPPPTQEATLTPLPSPTATMSATDEAEEGERDEPDAEETPDMEPTATAAPAPFTETEATNETASDTEDSQAQEAEEETATPTRTATPTPTIPATATAPAKPAMPTETSGPYPVPESLQPLSEEDKPGLSATDPLTSSITTQMVTSVSLPVLFPTATPAPPPKATQSAW